MKDLKELLEKIAESDDVEVKVHKFEPIEASPVEELFDVDLAHEGLVFESGLTEAVRRLLRKHDDYGIIKYVRTILDAEYEGEPCKGEKGE